MPDESTPDPPQFQRIRGSCFVETSFLMDLLRISNNRKRCDAAEDIRFRTARVRWNEALELGQPCYWSPTVFQEVIHSIASAVFNNAAKQREFGVEALAESLRNDPHYLYGVPPRFVSAIFPRIIEGLSEILPHLTSVDDVWSAPSGQSNSTLSDLMSLGLMGPADCVIALAAGRQRVRHILSHDQHFKDAEAYLQATFGISVLD